MAELFLSQLSGLDKGNRIVYLYLIHWADSKRAKSQGKTNTAIFYHIFWPIFSKCKAQQTNWSHIT